MDAREQRGLEIAAVSRITHDGNAWLVPSQTTGGKRYTVNMDGPEPRCTCPDHETRHCKCKHIFAVEFTVRRESTTEIETNSRGETTVTQTVTETAQVTYTQNWPAYNQAQVHEKRLFLELLNALCAGVDEPVQTFGRPRLSLADMVFASAYKVYSTVSGRRFMTDLADAHEKGYLTRLPCYNSVFRSLEAEELTPILYSMIERSSLPLKVVETSFAVDSSGFGTSRFERWFDVKHGGMISRKTWIKCHLMCGVQTNIVTSVEMAQEYSPDGAYLPPLVDTTARNFQLAEVSADKAYSTRANLHAIVSKGATPYVVFKSNARGNTKDDLWNMMYHYYSFSQEKFMTHYHKLSNIESTFSMIKRKFGDSLRSKTDTALKNEALLKVLCHNIVVVIHSVFELGIEPTFWPQEIAA